MLDKILTKYKSLSVPVRAALWFTACNFLLKGISFLTAPLFTRMLPDQEYGKLTLYMSYEHIILIFATWEIYLGAYQKGLFKYKENEISYTKSTILLTNVITAIVFIFVILFNKVFVEFTSYSWNVIALLFVYLLVFPAYNCWIVNKRTKFDYKKSVVATLLFSIFNVITPLIALNFLERTAETKFSFTLIASIVFCFVFYFISFKKSFVKQKKEELLAYWKFNLSFSAPLVLHSLSFLVLGQADRIMIGKMVGNSQAAYYGVAYTVSCAVIIFQNSIYQALKPLIFRFLEEKRFDEIKMITSKLLILVSVLILIFILVVPELFKLLFPLSYYEAVWCIPPIAAGVFFMFQYSLYVNVEEYYEKTSYVALVSIVCGIVNVLLNYYGIKMFGYIACAYTTLICYVIFSAGHYIFMKRTLKFNNIKENIVNHRVALLVSFAFIALTIVVTMIYEMTIVRYALGVLMAFVCVLNKERILSLFSMAKKGKAVV